MPAPALSGRKPLYYFLTLALLLLAGELTITRLARFTTTPGLPFAVTVDLVVGLPVLYYLFIVRRYKVGWTTVAGVFGLALVVAAWILPPAQQLYLGWFRKALLLAEPVLLVVLVVRLRRLVHHYRLAAAIEPDFLLNLAASFRAVFGQPLPFLVSEAAMVRYGLLGWLKPAAAQPGFSMHRESAFTAIMGTLLLVSVAEMGGVHLLVQRWNPVAAYWLLGLSVYGMGFLLGHLQAVRQRPLLLTATVLRIRVGLVWNFDLPLAALAAAEPWRDAEPLPEGVLNLAQQLITPPNVLLSCHHAITALGPYGLGKTTRQLALYVDKPAEFVQALQRPVAE
ncbi:hypothetical protein GCM10022408_08580 [Hymenobacter fastidiosus]|uniref:Uncharacterized protein n=1 Tax=Hymenobacter fastidiosus TaxID=486264 RepID=A0ABP7RN01_9BACT